MMGSGIALLPLTWQSRIYRHLGMGDLIIRAMSLAYVYARLATKNPQQGGPYRLCG